jgi:hypothetical protein
MSLRAHKRTRLAISSGLCRDHAGSHSTAAPQGVAPTYQRYLVVIAIGPLVPHRPANITAQRS